MTTYSATDIINPELDLAPYREEFERLGRVRVPDVLKSDVAEDIYAALQQAPWEALFLLKDKTASVSGKDLAAYTPQDQMNLRNLIFAETAKGFQYSYRSLALKHASGAAWDSKQVVPALEACMNSEEFLDIGRKVSGFDAIHSITAQATCYVPESFLFTHDDIADSAPNRLIAYVLGFTKGWKHDWGGLLQFLDPQSGEIIESFPPTFNSLMMFRVPQWHSVSFVAPFALRPRISVTGWCYSETKSDGNGA